MRSGVLRIGNAGGYWGDDPQALKRQVEQGQLDYITMDFLAEITMSILKKQQTRNPELGYAYDFVTMLEETLPLILEKRIKIITNAGGINPSACAQAIKKLARKMGLKPKVALVFGDDVHGRLDALKASGTHFDNMETSEKFTTVEERTVAANVYFGALPVVEALKKWDPDIIVTGRVTDSGITLAPMIHEFDWDLQDWDKLASGVVAGHLIECGSQVTGNFTDWELVSKFHDIGYPIVEVSPDGSFVLTKHQESGGYVSRDTAREQLFYEMGDPKNYITPDVIADFCSIQLRDDGENRVKISGVKGRPCTQTYKLSMAYQNGHRSSGSILVSGPDARRKAETFANLFWQRFDRNVDEKATEFLGWNACHRSLGHREDGNEIVLKLGIKSTDLGAHKYFGKLIPSLILSGPPGVTVLGGIPKPQSIINYWPALIAKDQVSPKVALWEDGKLLDEAEVANPIPGEISPATSDAQVATEANEHIQRVIEEHQDPGKTPLSEICLARSGDKGNTTNIGILARSDKAYSFIKEYLTAQRVKNMFQELCQGSVVRYVVDDMQGLNFLLEESLGGGGSSTLRSDAQGKTFSQALLRQRVAIPELVLNDVKNNGARRD